MKIYFKYGIFVLIGLITFYIGISLFKGTSAAPANSNFKDTTFYNCVIDGYNITNNASLDYSTNLSTSQLQSIKYLKCNHYTSDDYTLNVTGLNLLINLEELYLAGNGLTSLDVSKNTKLKVLDVESNSLTSINVSYNTLLEELDVSNNNISSINLVKNVNLIKLDLNENNISSVDLDSNTKLEELELSNNQLTSLDVAELTSLRILNVDDNNISSFTFGEKELLTEFSAMNNNLDGTFTMPSSMINLTELNLSNNKLDGIIVGLELNVLNVSGNELTSLQMANVYNLLTLIANDNKLSEIVLNNTLKYVQLSNNQLSSVALSGLSGLTDLYLENNELGSIDVTTNTNLRYLNVRNNNLTNLNISGNSNLESLLVDYNRLTRLDVSSNHNLKTLYAGDNQIAEFNSNGNTNLRVVDVSNNNLSSIDLSNNNNLSLLRIDGNEFEEEIYVYKGEEQLLGRNVNLPSIIGWSTTNWETSDTSGVISIVENNKVNGQSVGSIEFNGNLASKYTNKSIVNVVEITSTKYEINEVNNYISIDKSDVDNIEVIRSNIQYDENLELILVDDCGFWPGCLDIQYNGETLKRFRIMQKMVNIKLEIPDKYTVLEGNVITNVDSGTTVDTFGAVSSEGLTFRDASGNVVSSGVLKTGYTVTAGEVSYTLVINGDIDGDGETDLDDIRLLSRHILGISLLEDIYLLSADFDSNDSVDINDVIKLVRYINS